MTFHFRIALLVLISFYSCNNPDKKETTEAEKIADTAVKAVTVLQLKTDFPDRVFVFKKMADSTIEEQVIKYEAFTTLFIGYLDIYKNQPLYSSIDQENNTEAYNVLRDELVSLKTKIKKNIALLSKSQEDRLDSADTKMNTLIPQIYK